jgi:hypothetical protein
MSRPSSYDLLTVIHQEVKDLRNELSAQVNSNEYRINELEKFQSNITGKIGVGVLLVGGAVTFVMNVVWQFISDKIR